MDKYVRRASENIDQVMRLVPAEYPNRTEKLLHLWKARDILESMKEIPKNELKEPRATSPCPCGCDKPDIVEDKVLMDVSAMGHVPPEDHIKTILKKMIKSCKIDGVEQIKEHPDYRGHPTYEA